MRKFEFKPIDQLPEIYQLSSAWLKQEGLLAIGAFFIKGESEAKATIKKAERQFIPKWGWVPKWLAKRVPVLAFEYYGTDCTDVDAGWVIVVVEEQ